MNDKNLDAAAKLVSKMYIDQGRQARAHRESMMSSLLHQRRMPDKGWDDGTIEQVVHELSMMDSNNFVDNVGLGEREARVFSNLVLKRHYNMAHGIGRSGDIAAEQPKAAGSSLIYKLTNLLALDAIRMAGFKHAKHCLVLPLATGMSMTLVLLAMKKTKPQAKYVLMPRIDQKSCVKAISTAGLTGVILDGLVDGDEVTTNIEEMKRKIKELGPDNILCVLTTSSCFAPRVPDRLPEVAELCAKEGIGHVVNNAYGIQSTKSMHLVSEAHRVGRVDVVVSSTDKNFMVPVGGAMIYGIKGDLVEAVSQCYPGRASGSPIVDLFITLLSMGAEGFTGLLKERKVLYEDFKKELERIAEKSGLRLLRTSKNNISGAMSLKNLGETSDLSFLGSMLFTRCCSGARVVSCTDKKTIAGHQFVGFGSHSENYPEPYLSAACAIGSTRSEMDTFFKRLDKILGEFAKTRGKKGNTTPVEQPRPQTS